MLPNFNDPAGISDPKTLHSAVLNNLAVLVIDREYAKTWSMKSPDSSVRGITSGSYFLFALLVIAIIPLVIFSEDLKWYDGIWCFVLVMIAIAPKKTNSFRSLFLLATIVAAAYFFFSKSYFVGILFLIPVCAQVCLDFVYFAAMKEISAVASNNVEFFAFLIQNRHADVQYTVMGNKPTKFVAP